MDVEEGGNSQKVMVSFNRRKTTLKKKVSQLSKLCDVNIGMVCFGPDRTVETWPENKPEVRGIIDRYKGHNDKEREKYNLSGFLGTKKKKLEDKKSNNNNRNKNDVDQEKKKNLGSVYWTWDPRLDQFSEEELVSLCGRLDSKLQIVREEKIKLMKEKKEKSSEKAVVIHNEDNFSSPNNDNLNMLNEVYQSNPSPSPSIMPLQFEGNCSYYQQPDQNFGIFSENYKNNYTSNDLSPIYQVLPIAIRPPLPFSDESA
ncbi:hypothetical protein ACOSQ2_008522 [Xanthoceras sorbifolium]